MIDFTHNPIIPADYKSRGRGLPYEASPLGAFSVLALPIFPGASARQVSWAEVSLTDLSRDGRPSRSIFINQMQAKEKTPCWVPSLCWRYLFFRAVSSQVSWAEASLTSVFGMGTGGPSP